MTVFKDTRSLAADAVAMAIAILEGAAVDAPVITNNGAVDVPTKQTPVIVVDKDNVQEVLIDSNYYPEGTF